MLLDGELFEFGKEGVSIVSTLEWRLSDLSFHDIRGGVY
jgi:hypothetical protein